MVSEKHRVTVGRDGSIPLPEEVGLRLGITPGTTLEIEAVNGTELRVNLAPEEPVLIDEGGVLVVRGEIHGDVAGAVDLEREARIQALNAEVAP